MQNSPKLSPSSSQPEISADSSTTSASDTSNSNADSAKATSSQLSLIKRSERFLWLSALPPLLFVGIAMSARNPNSTVIVSSSGNTLIAQNSAPVAVLSSADTMVTSLKPIGGFATLNGQLQPAIQVRGEAPIEGRVTDVLVKPGQRVTVGDPILRVESRVKAPGSQSAMRKQAAAEAAQVEAAHQQEKLQGKLATRQEKLLAAQQRVAQAQKRVAQARTVVGRLAKGEHISRMEVAALATPELSTRLAARGSVASRRTEAREAAQKDTQKAAAVTTWRAAKKDADQARHESDAALAQSSDAKRAAQSAAKEVEAKKQTVKESQALLAKLQGAALDDAKTNLAKAQVAAQDAETKASDLQKAATLAESKSDKLRKASTEADRKLAKLPDPASFETREKTATPTAKPTEKTSAGGELLSPNEALQLAETAVSESKQAAAEAERLKDEIDSYSRQVNSLHATLNSTSSNLESAQMAVVESKIAEKLEAVRSPATGVVLDIADSSRSVAPGETIIAIGRPDRLEVRFDDVSEAWKNLKVGTKLPAAIQNGTQKVAVLAELQEIKEPKKGSPAILITAIDNPRQPSGGRRFRPGLAVQCSIPRPGMRQSLSVPSSALWRDDKGQTLIAVLVPVANAATPILSPTATVAEATPEVPPVADTPSASAAPLSNNFQVQWRTVTTGQGDALQQEIAGGLQAGERIALRPAELHDLTEKHGLGVVVQLSA